MFFSKNISHKSICEISSFKRSHCPEINSINNNVLMCMEDQKDYLHAAICRSDFTATYNKLANLFIYLFHSIRLFIYLF